MKIIEKIAEKQANIWDKDGVTIAFLGDSVTQGCFECYMIDDVRLDTVFDYQSAYSTRLKQMLNLLYPRVQVNVINSGISGDNAIHGFERLDKDVLRYAPDLVVVAFALNDSTGGEQGLDGYANALKNIFTKVKENGAECIFLTPNMMDVDTSCHLKDELFIRLSKEFADIQLKGILTAYVEKAKAVAKECEVPVCDMYAQWLKMQKGGVQITDILANYLNHPIRELHYYTAMKLLETMFM
jgi:lysophospholipase L1-like esterase